MINATAREFCIGAFNTVVALQEELGVAKSELPKNFNRYKKAERFDALRSEYVALADKLRAEKTLAPLKAAAELESARKACTTSFANVQRLRSKAGLKGLPSKSLKELSIEQLREYASSLQAMAVELAPKAPEPIVALPTDCAAKFLRREQELSRKVWVAKPAMPALAKAPTATVVMLVEKSAERLALEASFATNIAELAQHCKVLSSEHPLFHPIPGRLSDKNLTALVERLSNEIARIKREALIKEHEKRQKDLSAYMHDRRSGRTHQPFGVWSKMARR